MLEMTLPEIELICCHDPEGKRGKAKDVGAAFLGEHYALMKAQAYRDLPPVEKIAKRLRERNG